MNHTRFHDRSNEGTEDRERQWLTAAEQLAAIQFKQDIHKIAAALPGALAMMTRLAVALERAA